MAAEQTTTPGNCNVRCGLKALGALRYIWNLRFSPTSPPPKAGKLLVTSPSRLTESIATEEESLSSPAEETILYLAYGSNLSAKTFKGNRGIKPLSAVPVHVPSLDLIFSLAGIPYIEPCFANTRYRTPPPTNTDHDGWHKGLIGVVYEVTPRDYRTIIATEGGGASYEDVVVPCYGIPADGKVVDPQPSDMLCKAHTLLAPWDDKEGRRVSRPDPCYAQPSARYLKLITDGAEEHELPVEYLAYLRNLRPYTITTYRQKVGQALFLASWLPALMAVLASTRRLADAEGRSPDWLVQITGAVFRALWASYDNVFKDTFGDGERTMKEKDDEGSSVASGWSEKNSVKLGSRS